MTSLHVLSSTFSGRPASSSRIAVRKALVKFLCTSPDRIGREIVSAVTVKPSLWSSERKEAVSDISIDKRDGRGLSCPGALEGRSVIAGDGARSGVAALRAAREGDEGVDAAGAGWPKNEAKGLIRPNLPDCTRSFSRASLSCLSPTVDGVAALLMGGNGSDAVSLDRSNVGRVTDPSNADDLNVDIVACRAPGSRIACINDESKGRIDSTVKALLNRKPDTQGGQHVRTFVSCPPSPTRTQLSSVVKRSRGRLLGSY